MGVDTMGLPAFPAQASLASLSRGGCASRVGTASRVSHDSQAGQDRMYFLIMIAGRDKLMIEPML
jgi:hypothetical protein